MSERAYAAHAGISRGAVQKARTWGRLQVLHADGWIDAAASDARRAQATDPSMRRGQHAPSLHPVPESAVGAVTETLRERGLPQAPAAGGSLMRVSSGLFEVFLEGLPVLEHGLEDVDASAREGDQGLVVAFSFSPFAIIKGGAVGGVQRAEGGLVEDALQGLVPPVSS